MRGEERQGALGEGAQLLRVAGLASCGALLGCPWRGTLFWLALIRARRLCVALRPPYFCRRWQSQLVFNAHPPPLRKRIRRRARAVRGSKGGESFLLV